MRWVMFCHELLTGRISTDWEIFARKNTCLLIFLVWCFIWHTRSVALLDNIWCWSFNFFFGVGHHWKSINNKNFPINGITCIRSAWACNGGRWSKYIKMIIKLQLPSCTLLSLKWGLPFQTKLVLLEVIYNSLSEVALSFAISRGSCTHACVCRRHGSMLIYSLAHSISCLCVATTPPGVCQVLMVSLEWNLKLNSCHGQCSQSLIQALLWQPLPLTRSPA